VGRVLKIAILSIALTTFVVLAVFGVAIWVFIPLLPAGFIFGISLYLEWQQSHGKRRTEDTEVSDTEHRKAA
jgi:hypothetical protein